MPDRPQRRRWSGMLDSWPLQRRLRGALGGFAALLVLTAVVVVVVLGQAARSQSDEARRIFPARLAASQLLTALVDQETGLRGYAIARQDKYLVPYRQGLAAEGALRKQLDADVRGDGRARSDLDTVYAAITAWSQEYAELGLQDVEKGGALTTIDFGKELFDRVRATNAELDGTLAGELRDAQRQVDRDRRLVALVLIAMGLIVGAGLFGLQRALRSQVLTPLRALGRQVETVSRGLHDSELEPVGPPDLRAMGEGVESMRRELVRALAAAEAAQADLRLRAEDLARSNADLEQFAYVASHDLQEPLRKVASFCQLLEKRYSGQLDERGEQYLTFAVDGAKRMQQLITDLLTFSRVGRTSSAFTTVDLAPVIRRAWTGLEARVSEAAADLEVTGADVAVDGDPALLQMLFTNVLGNAVKYRRPDLAPRITVTVQRENDRLRVDADDNGIGIPPEYSEKVFMIFQRLHGRDEYEGTGIGLALCRKIVEFHGGTIGVHPSPLGGARVSFTLPSKGAVRADRAR